ncbi:uncharacterized protein LOC110902192 [Helianthus annuus]|uniref:uncharacterized protein LOC110902192 n=1 Tax=Helianthus annuus TaxID=4232 RepID=UPI000B8F41E0|nr:uncharacterized protein LOC110902192 [Helianthus annuus]
MNLAISAWTMDVRANTIANCFRHCKLRSTDNMTFENSDEGSESTQELQNLIKELGYRNAMDVEDVLTHPEENVVAQLLTDEEIIESVIGINKDDIDEEDDESSTMEPPSRNEAIKVAITLNSFLLSYEKTTLEVLTMLRKIRDEIQGPTISIPNNLGVPIGQTKYSESNPSPPQIPKKPNNPPARRHVGEITNKTCLPQRSNPGFPRSPIIAH